MATLAELREFNKSFKTKKEPLITKSVPAESSSVPALAEESPLNFMERLGWATMRSPEAKKEFLQQRFNQEDILTPEQSPVGDWAISTKKGSVFPVDPKGLGKGGPSEMVKDVAESLPDIGLGYLTTLGQQGGMVLGAAAAPYTAGIVNPVTGGMAGGAIAGGVGEYGLQKVGRMATGVKAPISKKDVAISAGTGMIPLGTISNKLFPKNTASKMADTIETVTSKKMPKIKQTTAGKNTFANEINEKLGLKNSTLTKDLIDKKIDTSKIMRGTGDEKIIKSAENISEILKNGRGLVGSQIDDSIKEKLSIKLGRKVTSQDIDALKIDTTNTKTTLSEIINNLNKSPIKSEQTKSLLKDLNTWQTEIKGNKKFNYGELKRITNSIYDYKDAAANQGDSFTAKQLNRIGAALTKDKHTNSIISEATKPHSKTISVLNALQNVTGAKIKPIEGELVDPVMSGARPLPLRLKRLTSEYLSPQLKALEKIENTLKKQPGFENITYISDLKAGLLNELLDRSPKKGMPFIPYAEKIPFIKDVMSPHSKARFYSGITEGTKLADKPISSAFPGLSSLPILGQAILGKKVVTPTNVQSLGRAEIADLIRKLTKPR